MAAEVVCWKYSNILFCRLVEDRVQATLVPGVGTAQQSVNITPTINSSLLAGVILALEMLPVVEPLAVKLDVSTLTPVPPIGYSSALKSMLFTFGLNDTVREVPPPTVFRITSQ